MDDETTQAEARVGRVLSSKWRLDRLLGVGGMAAVYEATHRNGMRAAVKVLHASLSANDEARHRFLAEGYAANCVQHPGVVAVLDDDATDDGALYLVMELLSGETLEARWSRSDRRMRLDEALGVASGLLGALEAAHRADVVHRDVKPENVFVTSDGQIKLLDFGIARIRPLAASSQRTQVGVAMGTPSFMPPEQARGRWDEVDARSDLWAVGATLYTLLTGRYVHDGETANETLLAAMTRHAESLAAARPDVPVEVAAIVDRALAVEKADRWQTAGDMLAAVEVERHRLFGAAPPRVVVAGAGAMVDDETGATETALALALSMRGATRVARSPAAWLSGLVLLCIAGLGVARLGSHASATPTTLAAGAERRAPPIPVPFPEIVPSPPPPEPPPPVAASRAAPPARVIAGAPRVAWVARTSSSVAPEPASAPTSAPPPLPPPPPTRLDPLGSRR